MRCHVAALGRATLDNATALNAFLIKVEKRAFRMAEIAVGNADDALDIVQDAMMKLATKYAHKSPDEWPPLFYRIVESRINDWHRRRKVRDGVLSFFNQFSDRADANPSGLDQFPSNANVQPEQIALTDELVATLVAVLRELPIRQQQVFLLRVWEGLDVRETAVAMKCSQGTVKTHLSRAMRTLRSHLGELDKIGVEV